MCIACSVLSFARKTNENLHNLRVLVSYGIISIIMCIGDVHGKGQYVKKNKIYL